MRRILFAIIFTLLSVFRLVAHEYSAGDIIEKDGISYKVLVGYLVLDPKESKDTIAGPSSFYRGGEVMVVKVNKNLRDVVIPTVVDRFRVVGLTDSLFYGHSHERIWLPNLWFAGNGCFAKLKMGSGALVIHNINNLGMGVFDDLDGDLILEITRPVSWGNAFKKKLPDSSFVDSRPKGIIKINTKMLRNAKSGPYAFCISASSKNYKKWIDKAFGDDEEFQKNDILDQSSRFCKRSFSIASNTQRNGLRISVSSITGKNFQFPFPWGRLTSDYRRFARYTVVNNKKKNTMIYRGFTPVADATQKEGWCLQFEGDDGIYKYTLNGNLIKK